MKGLIKFILIFTSILLVSAFLAPILFEFLPFKFERIFNRLVMIFSLTAIVLFVRIRVESLKKFGLIWEPQSMPLYGIAFLVGAATLLVLALGKSQVGMVFWQPKTFEWYGWILAFMKIIGAALLIGLIEEFFFRGFIYLTLKDRYALNVFWSVVITSIFYSLIHFIQKSSPFIGPDPTFFDSLKLIKAPFMSLKDWQSIWPSAIGLFIFGVILNLLFIRTKSLYASMGLHAGCVFFLKTDNLFVDFVNKNTLIWGSSKMYDSVLGWAALVMMGLILFKLINRIPKGVEAR